MSRLLRHDNTLNKIKFKSARKINLLHYDQILTNQKDQNLYIWANYQYMFFITFPTHIYINI